MEELVVRSRRVPGMLADLLSRGLASTKVIAVYSAIIGTSNDSGSVQLRQYAGHKAQELIDEIQQLVEDNTR